MIIERLKQKQKALNLSNTKMAEMLGYTRVHYHHIINGKSPLNDKFTMRVYRAFPDIFLPSDITNVKQEITGDNQSSPDKPQNRNLTEFWHWLRSCIKWLKF